MAESNSGSEQRIQRQTAFKCSVKDILRGKYIKEEGWTPNYILVDSKKLSRVNIIGIIVSVVNEGSFNNLLIDDGTGSVFLRFFEKVGEELTIGKIVIVIGRPREFGGERYIVPEIVKLVDNKWYEVRKKELALITESVKESIKVSEDVVVKEEVVEEKEGLVKESPVDTLINLIRNIDSGEGAAYEEIENKHKGPDCEELINKLLELGEIFEVKPGRFKVLD